MKFGTIHFYCIQIVCNWFDRFRNKGKNIDFTRTRTVMELCVQFSRFLDNYRVDHAPFSFDKRQIYYALIVIVSERMNSNVRFV